MNNLKKFLGILWIVLALFTAYFSIFELALPKISTGHQEDLVFGIIILCILTPIISIGLGLFGYYSLLGEYEIYSAINWCYEKISNAIYCHDNQPNKIKRCFFFPKTVFFSTFVAGKSSTTSSH